MTRPAPDSVPRCSRVYVAAALLLVILLAACGGKDKNENRIKGITATLKVDPFPGAPDPAVYLLKDPKDPRFPDIETVEVRLHTTSPIAFDAFTLEFTYDFQAVQIGDVFSVNPSVLGTCNAGTTCDPLCENNAAQSNQGLTVDASGKAHFVMGVAALAGCPTANVTSDTTLVTLAFIAATIIDPPGSRIELFTSTNPPPNDRGDCEILNGLVDLDIPCVDGNATMTAAR